MSEPPITADQIPWGQQVNSTRDRSLKARIERSIKTGDELEPTDRHLAALLELIDRDKDIERGGGRDTRQRLDTLAEARQHLGALDNVSYSVIHGELAKALGINRTQLKDIRATERSRVSRNGASAVAINLSDDIDLTDDGLALELGDR